MSIESKVEDQERAALERARKIAQACTDEYRGAIAQIAEKVAANINKSLLRDVRQAALEPLTFPENAKHGFNCARSVKFITTIGTDAENAGNGLMRDEFVIYAHKGEHAGRGTQVVLLTNLGRVASCVDAEYQWLEVDQTHRQIRCVLSGSITLPLSSGRIVPIPLAFLNALQDSPKGPGFADSIVLAVRALHECRPRLNEHHDAWLIQQETRDALEKHVKERATLDQERAALAQERAALDQERAIFDTKRAAFDKECAEEKKTRVLTGARRLTREHNFNDRINQASAPLRTVVSSILGTEGTSEGAKFLATEALTMIEEAARIANSPID
jgi:hypothetical protein